MEYLIIGIIVLIVAMKLSYEVGFIFGMATVSKTLDEDFKNRKRPDLKRVCTDEENYYKNLKKKPLFKTREQAQRVFTIINDIFCDYGTLTVADILDASGMTSTFEDYKYGWTEFNEEAYVAIAVNGYTIYMPPCKKLKNEER